MPIGAVGGVPAADYVPPVGIVLTLGVDTSPAERYPGTTWARIKDRFLWGASDAHPLGETGGSATHTLTVDEMPAHTHTATLNETGAHTHTISSASSGTGSYDYGYDYNYSWGGTLSTSNVSFSSAGTHTHTVTFGETGSGKPFDVMNPYTVKNVWRRVS